MLGKWMQSDQTLNLKLKKDVASNVELLKYARDQFFPSIRLCKNLSGFLTSPASQYPPNLMSVSTYEPPPRPPYKSRTRLTTTANRMIDPKNACS